MIEKGQRLHPGDILRNDWVGEGNTLKYTMYLKRGKCGSQKTIDCLSNDNRIINWCEHDNKLVVVGHLKAYDEFINALLEMPLMIADETKYTALKNCPNCGRLFTENIVCECGQNNANIRL